MATRGRQVEVLPGDRMGVIEEYEAGEGTYTAEDVVRARVLGRAIYDPKRRVITIKPLRCSAGIPSPGNEVMGQVEVAQANIINTRIYYINGKESQANFIGMIMTRPLAPGGRPRSRQVTLCKIGDLIRAKVISNVNSIIHLSIEGEKYGVIHSVCSLCGGEVVRMDHRIKCIECGFLDERKLSSDFGRTNLA